MNKSLIKARRIEKGYSQEAVARKLDITLRTYQKIENDESYLPNVITGLQLAYVLRMNPFRLWSVTKPNS